MSSISSVLLLILIFGERHLCKLADNECMRRWDIVLITLVPILPLFIFSLITYKMREEIFRVWSMFAVIWIPLSMFLILIAPEYGNDFVPIEKGTIAFFSSVLFCIISTGLIIWKHMATRPR